MLTNIHIENFALIDYLDIDVNEGLNIITGETGSGKSIILGAIGAVLGAKIGSDVIRAGEPYSFISASFHIDDANKLQLIRELDIADIDDGDIIIQRKILPNRSVYKVNGITVTAAQVRALSLLLIDIHSQRDNLSLLKSDMQAKLVDSFADEDLLSLINKQSDLYGEYIDCKNKLENIGDDESLREREIALLEYEVKEIEEASLSITEDKELEDTFSKLSHLEKIQRGVADTLRYIQSSDMNSIDLLGNGLKTLSDVITYDDQLLSVYNSLKDAEDILSGACSELDSYISNNELDEEELAHITERIDIYNTLKRKYNADIEHILSICEEKKERLDSLVNSDEYIAQLKDRIYTLTENMTEVCDSIHSKRVAIARQLEKKIISEMHGLNFNNVEFTIDVTQNNTFSYDGNDNIEFLISLNSGESVKPLKNIASGGEMSRIMLAIKSVIAEKDIIGTMIFDEIDTGISSKTAQCVAEKMYNISKSHQIICITHLPQIAAMADTHFYVYKEVVDDKTSTNIKELDEKSQVDELARFLGGSKITENVITNASEMKQLANNYKQNI